jgi:very-short-patch-repair endonuclease
LPNSPLPPEREGPGEGLSKKGLSNKDKAYDRQPTARSRELRNNPTDAERKLWRALSNRQLHGIRFNRQVVIRPYICDFIARSAKLIVEVDGGQHALNARKDQVRTRFLESHGYRVIRFWNNDVLANIDGVVETIARALRDRPSPGPSRSGGRGKE